MTKQAMIDLALSGQPVCVVEYRSTVTAEIPWRDPEKGNTVIIKKATHNVEAGPQALAITEKLRDDCDVKAYKPAFQKGQLCVWHVEGMSRAKGVVRYSGKLEPLDK